MGIFGPLRKSFQHDVTYIYTLILHETSFIQNINHNSKNAENTMPNNLSVAKGPLDTLKHTIYIYFTWSQVQDIKHNILNIEWTMPDKLTTAKGSTAIPKIPLAPYLTWINSQDTSWDQFEKSNITYRVYDTSCQIFCRLCLIFQTDFMRYLDCLPR